MLRLFQVVSILLIPVLSVTAASGGDRRMDLADVRTLLEARVGEEVILAQIVREHARFELSTEDILELKRLGASDRLIEEMIETVPEGDEIERDKTANYDRALRSDLEFRFYYDPFGYHWAAWPACYSYYWPSRWYNVAAYCGGYWDRRWCDWTWYPSCRPHYTAWSPTYAPTVVKEGRGWRRDAPRDRRDAEGGGRHVQAPSRERQPANPRTERTRPAERGWSRSTPASAPRTPRSPSTPGVRSPSARSRGGR